MTRRYLLCTASPRHAKQIYGKWNQQGEESGEATYERPCSGNRMALRELGGGAMAEVLGKGPKPCGTDIGQICEREGRLSYGCG